MIFLLQGFRFAADLAKVAEVSDSLQISPIPGAPPFITGAINFHGEIVATVDLGHFLALSGSTRQGKLIVICEEIAPIAFYVDSVVKIISGDEVTFNTPDNSRLAVAKLGFVGGEAILIDLEALAHETETGLTNN